MEEYNFSHCASAAAVAVAETAAIRIIKVSFFPSTFSSILLTAPWKRWRPPLRRFRYLWRVWDARRSSPVKKRSHGSATEPSQERAKKVNVGRRVCNVPIFLSDEPILSEGAIFDKCTGFINPATFIFVADRFVVYLEWTLYRICVGKSYLSIHT